MTDEHKISIAELYSRTRSSSKGLSSTEAQHRLKEYGLNRLKRKRKLVYLLMFLRKFTNMFAVLLFIGAGLAIFAESVAPDQGYLYIGIALLGVVILNGIFSFFQEYRSQKIMEKFQKMLPPQAVVLRDGKRKEILAEHLVPGDVIFLVEGDKVPADARLIEENTLKVDHSSITGESEPQLRSLECTHSNILETRNIVFSGTLVQSGNGRGVVYATGNTTQMGKIVELTESSLDVSTPLHLELARFIRHISFIAIFLGLLFFIIGFLSGLPMLGSLIFGVGIIVANVPEGLLPTVTLALSMASKRMAKKKALVRDLESVQTLGSTTVICTDKTGTLTENKMEVTSLFLDFEDITVSKGFPKTASFDSLLQGMVLCNNAQFDAREKHFQGDPTETALLEFATPFTSLTVIHHKNKRIHEYPFDSKTKRMITINKSSSGTMAFMKGAPELVLDTCDHFMMKGKIQKLTPHQKAQMVRGYKALASKGERVLAFAFKETKSSGVREDHFTLVGLVGMIDPPRPEVREAIAKCQSAGIRVMMITGDHSLTAEALAKEIGLVDEKKPAFMVTGDELEDMDEPQLKSILKKENLIFARTTPAEKLRIVKALQSMGEVVTVTGDGVNDAPALKNADMGVAMGLSGTEVARESSDMVLLDDNFATIVNAVEEGRTIFDNIKKFITYILTSNVPEIIPFIIFALFNVPLAMTVVLILCIDLGTDMLPAIGLGAEKPEEDVMKQKPRSKKERLLTRAMLFRAYGIMGLIQTAGGFFAFFTVLFRGGWRWGQELAATNLLHMEAVTAFFAAVVIGQIANVFICRARREPLYKIGMFSNKWVWMGIGVELLLLVFIVYFPYAHSFFGTQPLAWWELLLGVPFAGLMIFLDGMRKFFLRREVQWVEKYLSW